MIKLCIKNVCWHKYRQLYFEHTLTKRHCMCKYPTNYAIYDSFTPIISSTKPPPSPTSTFTATHFVRPHCPSLFLFIFFPFNCFNSSSIFSPFAFLLQATFSSPINAPKINSFFSKVGSFLFANYYFKYFFFQKKKN